jgi:hypothetical protein
MDNQHQVDARYQYRFAYGDIVCYPLSEKERRWKFDTKNELGFYLGDKKGMKGGCHVYQPYWHKILTRGDVHRIRLSEFELMEWYGKRAHVRQSGLSWSTVEEAIVDLLQHKPYMNARTPRPAVEEPTDTDDSSDDDDGQDHDGDNMEQEQPPDPDIGEQPMHNHVHPNTILLPIETRPIEELRAGARRRSSRKRKRPANYIEESYQEGETVWGDWDRGEAEAVPADEEDAATATGEAEAVNADEELADAATAGGEAEAVPAELTDAATVPEAVTADDEVADGGSPVGAEETEGLAVAERATGAGARPRNCMPAGAVTMGTPPL